MKIAILPFLRLALVVGASALSQEIPITDIAVDAMGRIRIEVASTPDHDYVLTRRIHLEDDSEWAVSVTLGQDGPTTLTEPSVAHGPFEL